MLPTIVAFAMTGTIGDGLDYGLALTMIRGRPMAWLISAIVPAKVGIVFGLPFESIGPRVAGFGVVEGAATGLVAAFGVPAGMHLVGQAYRTSMAIVAERQQAAVQALATPVKTSSLRRW